MQERRHWEDLSAGDRAWLIGLAVGALVFIFLLGADFGRWTAPGAGWLMALTAH